MRKMEELNICMWDMFTYPSGFQIKFNAVFSFVLRLEVTSLPSEGTLKMERQKRSKSCTSGLHKPKPTMYSLPYDYEWQLEYPKLWDFKIFLTSILRKTSGCMLIRKIQVILPKYLQKLIPQLITTSGFWKEMFITMTPSCTSWQSQWHTVMYPTSITSWDVPPRAPCWEAAYPAPFCPIIPQTNVLWLFRDVLSEGTLQAHQS